MSFASTSSSSSSILGKRRRSVDHSLILGDCMWLVFAYFTAFEITRTMCKVSTSWKQAAVHTSLWRDMICENEWDEQETTEQFNWCRRNDVKLYHTHYDYFHITPTFLHVAASSLRSLVIDTKTIGGEYNHDLRIFTSLENVSLRLSSNARVQYHIPDSVRTLVLYIHETVISRWFMQANKSMLHHIQTLQLDIEGRSRCWYRSLSTFAGVCTGVQSLTVVFRVGELLRYEMTDMYVDLCPNATTMVLKNCQLSVKKLSITNTQLQHLVMIQCDTQSMSIRIGEDMLNSVMVMPNLKTLIYDQSRDREMFDVYSCAWINNTVLPQLQLLLYHRPHSLLQHNKASGIMSRISNAAPNVLVCIELANSELVVYNKRDNTEDTNTHGTIREWMKPNTENGTVDFIGIAAHVFPALNTVTAKFAVLDKYLTREPTLGKYTKVDTQ